MEEGRRDVATLLADADRLIEEIQAALELRAREQQQLKDAVARLGQAMGGPAPVPEAPSAKPQGQPVRASRTGKKAKAGAAGGTRAQVLEAVTKKPTSGREIFEILQKRKVRLSEASFWNHISKLTKTGEIKAQGAHPNRLYSRP